MEWYGSSEGNWISVAVINSSVHDQLIYPQELEAIAARRMLMILEKWSHLVRLKWKKSLCLSPGLFGLYLCCAPLEWSRCTVLLKYEKAPWRTGAAHCLLCLLFTACLPATQIVSAWDGWHSKRLLWHKHWSTPPSHPLTWPFYLQVHSSFTQVLAHAS